MTDAILETLEYNPPNMSAKTPPPTMLMLHGLGASGADLYPLAAHIGGGKMRVLFPNAPIRAVTINGGFQMPAWYDITGMDLVDRQDAAGVLESTARINEILTAEQKRGTDKIYLGGFSQGAAMSVHVGLRHAHALSGIIVLSGYMLRGETLAAESAKANRQVPIFQAQGLYDPVVLPQWARQCHDSLVGGGWSVSFNEYPAAHTIPPQAIADLNSWLEDLR